MNSKQPKYTKTKLVHGVGINDADYAVTRSEKVLKENGKFRNVQVWICPFYQRWRTMLGRVYSSTSRKFCKNYADCVVCEEWHLFSTFRGWMQWQDWEGKELDKDILIKGNKTYSPETCVFVDKIVNTFFNEREAVRGEYPTGVDKRKVSKSKPFIAYCSNPFTGVREYLGYYSTSNEAHKVWLKRKTELAILLADMQTNPKVAEAIILKYINYEVQL